LEFLLSTFIQLGYDLSGAHRSQTLNRDILPLYIMIPLQSMISVLDGRNSEETVFAGKYGLKKINQIGFF